METVKCPHCKKEIELSEVTEEHAKNLAAQKINEYKDTHKQSLQKEKEKGKKEAEQELKDKFIKDQKAKDQKIKELEKDKENNKKAIERAGEKAKKEAEQELKDKFIKDQKAKDQKIKELEKDKENNKKAIEKARESATAIANAKAENKALKDREKDAQEKAALKIKLERVTKDLQRAKQRTEQGLTADQGAAQHNLLGDNLKKIFSEYQDEIKPYETGEAGADWLHIIKDKGTVIGKILYESKQTQRFAQDWYGKLQGDLNDAKADVGIIFTTAVPKEFDSKKGFIEKGNIFVCNFNFEKLKVLALFQRKLLLLLNSINKNNEDNKISALEFLNSPDVKNLLGTFHNKMTSYEDIVGRHEKLNRDIRKNYLDLDGLFDELFQFTAEFGIKRPDKKNKIQK